MAGEAEIERMVVRLLGDASNYEQSLKRSAKATQTFAQRATAQLKKVSQGMKNLGRNLSLRVTAPLTILGAVSVKAFSNFDKAMTESTSIMKVTEAQIAEMRKTVIGLSAGGKVLQGPKDLAEAYFFLASAGKDAEQSMALLPVVSKFATAGAFNMALATDLLTDAQSALGLSSKDVAKDTENMIRLGDMLVGANTLANASVQQFSTALTSKAGAAFKSYNIKLEEGIALLAAYADQGIKAELAGNAADRMIRLLTKAVAENAGEFERLNVQVFDASGEFRPFKAIIGDIERATKDLSTEQKAAALTSLGFAARVQSVILPLLGTSDAIGEYVEKLGNMKGVMESVSSKQMKAFGNQMKVLKNQLTVVAIEIGSILAPMILKLSKFIKRGIEAWGEFTSQTKKAVVAFGLVAATLGPALIALGSSIGIMGLLLHGITLIGPALAAISASFISMGVAASIGWAAATLGLSLAIPALAGLTFGLIKLQKETGVFDPLIDSVQNLFKELKKNLLPQLKEIWTQVKAELLPALVGFHKILIVQIFTTLPAMVALIDLLTESTKKLARNIKILGFVTKGMLPKAPMAFLSFLKVAGKVVHDPLKGKEPSREVPSQIAGLTRRTEALLGENRMGLGGGLGLAMKVIPETILQAMEKAQQATEEWTMSLEDQIATFGMTTNEARLYQAGLAGVTEETLNLADANVKLLASMEKNKEGTEAAEAIIGPLRREIFQLENGLDNLDMAYLDLIDTGIVAIAGISPLVEFSDLAEKKRAFDAAKKLQKKAGGAPLSMRAAAQVGTAEAQSRIMAFKQGAGITSDAKRTADNTEEIKDILTDIRDGEGMNNLQPAGLRRS